MWRWINVAKSNGITGQILPWLSLHCTATHICTMSSNLEQKLCHCLTKTLHSVPKGTHSHFQQYFFLSNKKVCKHKSYFSKPLPVPKALPTKTVSRTLPVEMMLLRLLALFPASSASECSDQILPQRKSRVKGLAYSEPSPGVRLQEEQGVLGWSSTEGRHIKVHYHSTIAHR